MAPERWRTRLASAFVLFAAVLFAPPSAHALRILDYNILNYPGSTGPSRDPYYRTILAPLSPDVIVTEEMTSQAGVTEFLGSLNTMEPGQWAALPFVKGNDTDAALFYKPAKVAWAGQSQFYPNQANLLRYVHVYRIRPAGYTSNSALIHIYSVHLKASQGFESQRLAECTGLRDSMNTLPAGSVGFAVGDFNFYTGTEPGLTKMLEVQADNDGRLYDPLGLQGVSWQDNTSMQPAWTQSPCKTGDTGCASGASTGGMDDRFDLILPTLGWSDGQGYELVPGTYISVGNDGLHHNNSIMDPPTIPEGAAYAQALHTVSDHLPVRLDVQVPARAAAPSALAFGSVIVGAVASQNLSVSNTAALPADVLDYSLSAGAGFTAPGGTFHLAAGAPANAHAIGMSTAVAGVKSASLIIASDDIDTTAKNVSLTGTVLDHAQASLDSGSVVVSGETIDFGSHASGDFASMMARVHNVNYSSTRARLAVNGFTITGGDGRFSLAGPAFPALVSGVGETWTLTFNDAGATQDQSYDGTLTFASADEPLPGAVAQPDLVVALHAQVTSGSVAVPRDPSLPTVTRLHAPSPNPVSQQTVLAFDLARAANVRLDVHDLNGRRVAVIAEGTMPAGRFQYPWDARGASGSNLGSGLYFVRLTVAGEPAMLARLAIIR